MRRNVVTHQLEVRTFHRAPVCDSDIISSLVTLTEPSLFAPVSKWTCFQRLDSLGLHQICVCDSW